MHSFSFLNYSDLFIRAITNSNKDECAEILTTKIAEQKALMEVNRPG